MIGDRLNLSARWRENAACKGKPTSLWFALPRTYEADLAAEICARCPVAAECAAEGRERRELGRWGEYVRLVEKYWGTRPRPWLCDGCGDAFLSVQGLRSHQFQKPCSLRGRLVREVADFERDIAELEEQVRRAV